MTKTKTETKAPLGYEQEYQWWCRFAAALTTTLGREVHVEDRPTRAAITLDENWQIDIGDAGGTIGFDLSDGYTGEVLGSQPDTTHNVGDDIATVIATLLPDLQGALDQWAMRVRNAKLHDANPKPIAVHPSLSRSDVVNIVAHNIEGTSAYVEKDLADEVLAIMGTRDLLRTLEEVLPNNEGEEREGMVADLRDGVKRPVGMPWVCKPIQDDDECGDEGDATLAGESLPGGTPVPGFCAPEAANEVLDVEQWWFNVGSVVERDLRDHGHNIEAVISDFSFSVEICGRSVLVKEGPHGECISVEIRNDDARGPMIATRDTDKGCGVGGDVEAMGTFVVSQVLDYLRRYGGRS